MKHRSLNQKGFTLIELLAVISILAILMLLAASSVTGIIANSSKKAFVIDAQHVVENAQLAYMDVMLTGTQKGTHFCLPLEYLKSTYIERISSKYKGSVEVTVSGTVATYKLWLSNGQYVVSGVDFDAIEASVKTDGEDLDNASSSCGGSGTLISKS